MTTNDAINIIAVPYRFVKLLIFGVVGSLGFGKRVF
jgi:hypothetical protein